MGKFTRNMSNPGGMVLCSDLGAATVGFRLVCMVNASNIRPSYIQSHTFPLWTSVNINSYKSWEDAHGNRPLGTVAGWTDVKGGVCFVCNICNVCIEHAFVHCLYNEKMIKNITKSSLWASRRMVQPLPSKSFLQDRGNVPLTPQHDGICFLVST